MLITTPLVGNETTSQLNAWLETVLDFYNGPGFFAPIRNSWGSVRSSINTILGPGGSINVDETYTSFVSDLNRLNNLYDTLPGFFGGSLRVWHNYSDVSNLWLDAARTSPITGAGEAIAGVTDRSGLDYHGEQSTLTSRPNTESVNGGIRALFDGAADSISSVIPVDYAGSDAVTVSVAVNKASDTLFGVIAESGRTALDDGSWGLFGPRAGGEASFAFQSRGTTNIGTSSGIANPAPTKNVVTGLADISTPVVTLRVDGTQVSTNAASQGTGGYTNRTLWIGGRNGAANFFNGSIGNLMILNKVADANELRILREIGNRTIP